MINYFLIQKYRCAGFLAIMVAVVCWQFRDVVLEGYAV